MTKLYIEDDAGNVQVLPFDADEITVGRAEDNVIVLPDRNVSRHHAKVRQSGGRFFIADAGARYGLRVNGSRLQGKEAELKAGDLVLIGDYKMKVLARDAAIAEEEAPRPVREEATAPAIPEIARTGSMDIREMERVAQEMGWRSDFELEEEGGRGLSAGKIVLLAFLVVVAGGLVALFFMLSTPTEIAPRTPPPSMSAPVEEPEPAAPSDEPTPVAAPAPVAAPEPRRPIAAPVAPAPQERRVVEERKAPAPAPAPSPRVAAVEPRPEPPRPAAPVEPPKPAGNDVAEKIEALLSQGQYPQAEALLASCKGPDCFRLWKKLASGYRSVSNTAKAIETYQRLRRMTSDPKQKATFEAQIQALGGSVD